ncbi:MAG: prephenate dehydrogenase/arogenate dehydrogenase family protein [Actinobacteria bacterium]|nr:prephenate dehydrogenase/arogenate dehydrogenase family protein [Actinomycetota bacterium]
MTRIAAGHPGIWPDICAENRDAILEILDALIAELSAVRNVVDDGNRPGLLARLERARDARLNLPTTAGPPEELVELQITVQDRPGELATVTTMATELQVNIFDIEISHSAERPRGLLALVIDAAKAPAFVQRLVADGYAVAQRGLQ